jgi:hypothetical protein
MADENNVPVSGIHLYLNDCRTNLSSKYIRYSFLFIFHCMILMYDQCVLTERLNDYLLERAE